MLVNKSISQDIFHLQTMCDGVQRITRVLASVWGLPLTFNMYLELHTFYGGGMSKKEKQLIFHASQRATSFPCRTEAMTSPGKWPPGPNAQKGFGCNARLKIQRRKLKFEWKEFLASRIKVFSKSVML